LQLVQVGELLLQALPDGGRFRLLVVKRGQSAG
jgi:hypothetical protein